MQPTLQYLLVSELGLFWPAWVIFTPRFSVSKLMALQLGLCDGLPTPWTIRFEILRASTRALVVPQIYKWATHAIRAIHFAIGLVRCFVSVQV